VNGLGELSLLAGDWLAAEVDADLADSLLAFALGPLPGSQSYPQGMTEGRDDGEDGLPQKKESPPDWERSHQGFCGGGGWI
jgi:hypothetical protein